MVRAGPGRELGVGRVVREPIRRGRRGVERGHRGPDARVVGRRVLGGAVGAAFVRAVGRRVRRAVGRDVVAHVHVRPTSRGRVIRGSASSESGLPEAAWEQETRSWSDAPPCGKSGGGWAPSMVAESWSEAWTGEIPNESFETFEELGTAESFETYESFEPFTSSMEGETPGSPRDAVEHWKKWLCSGTQGNRVMPLIDGPTTFTAMKEAIDTATDNTISSTCSHGGATPGSTSPIQARRCSTCSTPRDGRECRFACSCGTHPRPYPGSRTTRACTTRPKRRSTASRTASRSRTTPASREATIKSCSW